MSFNSDVANLDSLNYKQQAVLKNVGKSKCIDSGPITIAILTIPGGSILTIPGALFCLLT